MSLQLPSTSNFQPWYTQRRPASSLRPKNSDAPRCGQLLARRPTLPMESRKAMSCSPRRRTRTGSESAAGNSEESMAGSQYWRIRLPIGVPGPTLVTRSLSSLLSMASPVVETIVRRKGRFGKRSFREHRQVDLVEHQREVEGFAD